MPGIRTRWILASAVGLLVAGVAVWGLGWGTVVVRELGPVDGHDLSGVDVGRLSVGDLAPDFTLEAYQGDRVTLSDFRDQKSVLLVFYRGHW